MPYATRNAVFQKLGEVSTIEGMTHEERLKYDHALKIYRDRLAVRLFQEDERKKWKKQVQTMEKILEKKTAEAQAKGMEEGMARGKAKGRAEGMEEVATTMIAQGVDAALIALYTKLSPERIMEIAELAKKKRRRTSRPHQA